jgi:4-amino-4-deoxy-L-arabinose transferase-like glycosyltransferase
MILLVSQGATSQDAQEAEVLQGHLAAGYQLRNPPLYTWLLWSAQQVVGSGLSSYLIVRYGLISAIGVLYYFAVLRLSDDREIAAAFSLSLVLFYWFGWEAHTEVSHSLALIAMLLAFWLSALNYVDHPTLSRALVLGAAIGIGLLAKWSFVFIMLGFGTALLLNRDARAAFSQPRSVIIPLIAAVIILPHLLWLIALDRGTFTTSVNVVTAGSPVGKTVNVLTHFLGTLCVVFLPWIAAVGALAYMFRKTHEPNRSTEPVIGLALISACISGGALVALLALTTLAGINLFGIADFAPHYLHPFCILASMGIAGLISTRMRRGAFSLGLGSLSLLAALTIFVAKLVSFYSVLPGSSAGQNIPYAQLATELANRGFANAQFVTLSTRDAGNLDMYLPQARALSPSRRKEPPPPDPDGSRPCVLLVGDEYYVPPASPKPTRLDRLLSPLGLNTDRHPAEAIEVDWRRPLFGESRRSVWHLVLDPASERACKRFVAKGGVRLPLASKAKRPRNQ